MTPPNQGPQVRLLSGGGVVAHRDGLLLACDASYELTERLLDALWRAAGEAPGRMLIRRVARVLAETMTDELASCAVAGPAEGGAVVLVSGSADVTVAGAEGEVTLGGRTATTWTDRFVMGPVRRIELRLPGAGEAGPLFRLDSGVVPGGGLAWLADVREAAARPVPREAAPRQPSPRQVPAADERTLRHPDRHQAVPQLAGPQVMPHDAEEPTPFRTERPAPGDIPPDDIRSQPFESVLLIEPDGKPAPAPPPPTMIDPEPDARPLVWGGECKNGHFNDPRAHYCGVCGIGMAQLTIVPRQGPRPPLGVLLLDDGMALRLDTDYLVGRDPEQSEDVRSGRARPARVDDQTGSVSRRHLRIHLNDWNVELVDLGSVNGTYIAPPGESEYRQIPPNQPVRVLPGTMVRLGATRNFRYESHRKH